MATFRPKARLVEILGEHLIRDNTVGLLELVKNAYDADATLVEIKLEHLDNPDKTKITIADNGEGMSMATLIGPWLEPASGHKELQKEQSIRSKRGRLPLGEKGIGRFAAHKLGKHLTLITRHQDSKREIVLDIDWKPFENHDAYLEDIQITPKERDPKLFRDSSHGTCVVMSGAREVWADQDLRRLQASLQKLKSPTRGAADFDVKFYCPDRPQYESLETVSLLDKAHFTLTGVIDDNGLIEYDYSYNMKDQKSSLKTERRDLWFELHPRLGRKPNCGPFFIDLRVWLRKADLLREAGVSREQLNAFCGVRLFRDGIRVLPYGEEGDDWLLLDKRRIDDPTVRFANNQIIGFVEIDQSANQKLIDKANREGLQENEAFHDLCDLVKSAVKSMEQLSSGERNKLTGKSSAEEQRDDVQTSISDIEKAARETEKQARALPHLIEKLEADGWIKPDAALELTETVEKQAAIISAIREKAEIANYSVNELFSSEEKEREEFLHLVAVGMAAERFTHEYIRLVKLIKALTKELKRELGKNSGALQMLGDLEKHMDVLESELIPLNNLTYRHTLPGNECCDVKNLLDIILFNNDQYLKKASIEVSFSAHEKASFLVPVRETVLAQVIDNIIDNSVYWLSQKSAIDERKLGIFLDPKARTILMTNSGPPIAPNMSSRLFEKFQTAKLHGRGLGLYICRELLTLSGGTITTVDAEADTRCMSGASFLIGLPIDSVKRA